MPARSPDVSLAEMVEVLATAFRVAAPTRAEIIGVAVENHARPRIIALLEGLPDRRYMDVRDIWSEFPQVAAGT